MFKRTTSILLSTLLLANSTPLLADSNTALQAYIQAWGEQQPEKRRQLLEKAVTDHVTYLDPQVSLDSRLALEQYIGQTQTQVAGLRAEIVGKLQQNKNSALFNWRIYNGDDQLIARGVDAVSFAKDGRLQRLEGFFDTQLEQN